MNDFPDRDVVVFAEALQLSAGERSAYLERACGADEELRQRVERLNALQPNREEIMPVEPLTNEPVPYNSPEGRNVQR